jgi:hypothetical protein
MGSTFTLPLFMSALAQSGRFKVHDKSSYRTPSFPT